MNQKRRLGRFKKATTGYDRVRAMYVAQKSTGVKNVANVTVGSRTVGAEKASPRSRRHVTTVTAR